MHPPKMVAYDGWKVLAHPCDNHTEYWLALYGAPPESETYAFLLSEIRGKRVEFFDIGANNGVYSLMVSTHAHPRSTILAFEPNPEMLRRLRRNIALSQARNITVMPFAVGEDSGTMALKIPRYRFRELGSASLLDQGSAFTETRVTVTTLAATLPARQPDCDLRALKIDVEGYEDRALYSYLSQAPVAELPDIIIIEYVHGSYWTRDLYGVFRDRDFAEVARVEGNIILRRQA